MNVFRLATRGSPLALWQARTVAHLLRRAWPGLRTELVVVSSTGDIDRTTPLYAMGVTGVFSKEVHAAVLDGRADAGVHSCKDLPTASPQGVRLQAMLRRADPRDALVGAASLDALPLGAVVGTSSLRRREQLRLLRPDLSFTDLRGNVETRLRKVRDGAVAATVMAMAGLSRTGAAWRCGAAPFAVDAMVPAPAQGAVAIDSRSEDRRAARLLAAIDHPPTRRAVDIERLVLATVEGGCSLPMGCLATAHDGAWRLRVRWCAPHGAIACDRLVAGRAQALALAEWLRMQALPNALPSGTPLQ